jgi:outer membrane protein OmpA-like peptidoglycan-associated protein
MKIKKIDNVVILVSFCLGMLFMSGCATTKQENPLLLSAHNAFTQIQNDPNINKYAPLELQEAKIAIEDAQKSWEVGDDSAKVEHLAYMAKQKALIASEVSSMKKADKELESASTERSLVLLGARTKEAEQSLSEAEKARREAEIQRLTAQEERRAADKALREAKRLEAKIAEMNARQTERGLVLTLGDVLFDTGKSSLKSGAFLTIDKLAEFLKEYPNRRVQIEGFTDSVGSEEYNLDLSVRRAEAVRNALNGRGIELDRILYRGYGEMYPVANNDNPAGRQRNRRVEIIISDKNGMIPERMR